MQQFKQDPRPATCLHSIFHVHTGDELLSYEEYGHLQVKRDRDAYTLPLRRSEAMSRFKKVDFRNGSNSSGKTYHEVRNETPTTRAESVPGAGREIGLTSWSTSKRGSWAERDFGTRWRKGSCGSEKSSHLLQSWETSSTEELGNERRRTAPQRQIGSFCRIRLYGTSLP